MTVKLLVDRPIDGKEYKAGNLCDTDDNTEAGLISAKLAIADLAGGTAYVAPVIQPQIIPVTATTNLTGVIEIDGMSIVQALVPNDFEIMFSRPTGPQEQIRVPSPYSLDSGYVVHPAIVFIPSGFNGYKYWMAYTPLPNNNNEFENPCIAASNDAKTWVLPNGCPNPLYTRVGSAYNRDTHLYFDGDKLCLIWNTRNEPVGKTTIKISTSSNGSDWSPVIGIWQGSIGTSDLVSPSLWYESDTEQWVIVGVNSESAGLELRKITSSNLLSGWDLTPTTINFPPPIGRKWWHPWFTRLKSGRIVGVVMDNDGTPGGSGWTYVAQSFDGVNYESAVIKSDGDVLRVAGKYYRPTALFKEVNGKVEGLVIYSFIEKDYFLSQSLTFDQSVTPSFEYKRLSSACSMALIAPSSALLAADDFSRADSTTGLGSTLNGKTWGQIDPANPIGIMGGTAYAATAGNCIATLNVDSVNYSFITTFAQLGAQGYMVVNRVDSTHFWRFGHSAGVLQIQRYNGSKDVDALSTTGMMLKVNDILRVDISGQSAKFYHNGQCIYTANGTLFANCAVVGLQGSGATPVKFGAIAVDVF